MVMGEPVGLAPQPPIPRRKLEEAEGGEQRTENPLLKLKPQPYISREVPPSDPESEDSQKPRTESAKLREYNERKKRKEMLLRQC